MNKPILLIMPNVSPFLKGTQPPSGLGYLSASLNENNIAHDAIDLRVENEELLDQLFRENHYRYIGLTLLSYGAKASYALIESIKKKSPASKIIVGGPHACIMAKKIFKECPQVDFYFQGEAEKALVELCASFKPKKIPGLSLKNKIKNNPVFCQNLDELPFPKYEKFDLKKYSKEKNILSSRGCPFHCTFCSVALINGRRYRQRSVKHILSEIDFWVAKGIKKFNIQDDNFCANRQRAKDLCRALYKQYKDSLELVCSQGIRADCIDREVLSLMKKCGLNIISMGVDGSNDKTLKIINKGETLAQIEKAIKMICQLKIKLRLLFLIGFPRQTEADVEDAFKLALKYPITSVEFYNVIPFPGTKLFEEVKKYGTFLMEPFEYLSDVNKRQQTIIFTTPELDKEQRERLLKKAEKIKRKVKKKFLDRAYPNILFKYGLNYLLATKFVEKLFFQMPLIRDLGISFLRKNEKN